MPANNINSSNTGNDFLPNAVILTFNHNFKYYPISFKNKLNYIFMDLKNQITVISFDADDTLWINEPYFQEIAEKFYKILNPYAPKGDISDKLYKMEVKNLVAYGYGVKGCVLSMLEAAIHISKHKITPHEIENILKLAKELINKPLILLDNVEQVLKELSTKYRLIIATKGDLLDQRRKLKQSGLSKYFHHIEVMTDKKEENYLHLLSRVETKPNNFLMIGNSIKSDVLPVINIEGYAIHIPYHVTWQHEQSSETNIYREDRFQEVKELKDILKILL
jgi:putative hydrolase of the HAD superfamily